MYKVSNSLYALFPGTGLFCTGDIRSQTPNAPNAAPMRSYGLHIYCKLQIDKFTVDDTRLLEYTELKASARTLI